MISCQRISLFWEINFTSFQNDYPTLRLAELDAGYKNLHKINTNISSTPIILAEDNYNSLLVFTYITEKSPFGFINCEIALISSPWLPFQEPTNGMNEGRVCDVPEYFPDI